MNNHQDLLKVLPQCTRLLWRAWAAVLDEIWPRFARESALPALCSFPDKQWSESQAQKAVKICDLFCGWHMLSLRRQRITSHLAESHTWDYVQDPVRTATLLLPCSVKPFFLSDLSTKSHPPPEISDGDHQWLAAVGKNCHPEGRSGSEGIG